MTTISIDAKKTTNVLSFNTAENAFYGSEKDIPFATQYKIINLQTKKFEVFEFMHSTGPEFDPETQWIYKSIEKIGGIRLIICNDLKITKLNAAAYLEHKHKLKH